MHFRALLLALGLTVVLAVPGSAADRAALIDVAAGEIPNDTALENKTRLDLVEHPDLGRVLKVAFASGDSVGDTRVRVKEWSRFQRFEFQAHNPADGDVKLLLTVKHRGTSGYRTRIDVPLALHPGSNTVKLDLRKLRNIDGSRPDLSAVRHWYLSAPGGEPTLYFGSFYLAGKDGGPHGDPARLARIRAARMPEITEPVPFHTPEADAILAALEVFPPDHPFNQVVSDWPRHPDSDAIIGSIGPEKPLRYNPDMAFILVPPDQPKVDLVSVHYAAESDPGPFPIPDNLPLEGWPAHYRRHEQGTDVTLADVQRDAEGRGGDRHAIVVDPVNRMLYEFFTMKRTTRGWQAGQASVFDLKTNKMRPEGWTSADAAGLPIFPAVVRYDELRRGIVEHAMRVTVRRTRRAYVYPARHYASRHQNKDYPRMGERIRLKADYDISGFSPPVRAILKGLKKYGMFVADNGIDWAISVAPDPRIPVLHEELRRIRGSAFEVVVSPDADTQ